MVKNTYRSYKPQTLDATHTHTHVHAHTHTHTASDCDISVMVEWIQQKMEEIAGDKDRICEITRPNRFM